ncbi:MAG: hypothetical protein DWQ44_04585 [Bacteroidetes bacterium]|nr:MAG: hypothetical protein DWQ33_11205 [Bacteroidota bacterium]REK00652.1 MAG: hypothetical protein DWQ39_10880 [Bacteroidota bacterium]REK35226.1 MAG: hypothetical protein DWQ44_04585 [Bacteroidota bacterium]REK48303.1 MAG: hypothetical protein DWQ48_10785 [Bacteroidota bacterium]
MSARFNSIFISLERKLGPAGMVIFAGLILLLIAGLFTSPRWELFYHGKGFTRLSENPFDFSDGNPLRYRILSPLIAYVTFLKGPLMKYLMLGILGLFLGLVYSFHRKKNFMPAESFGIALLLSLTSLTFFQFHFPAYNDPLSYVLIMQFLMRPVNITGAIVILSLMLFNHENLIFLFPFLFMYRLWCKESHVTIRQNILVFVASLIPYAAYRFVLNQYAKVDFDSSYYFQASNIEWTLDHVSEWFGEGVFQALRLAWLLPLAAIAIGLARKNYKDMAMISVCIVFVLSQMLIAFDISRLSALAFPAVLIGAQRVRETFGSKNFLNMLFLLIIMQMLIPSKCIGALEPIPLPPFWWDDFQSIIKDFFIRYETV